MSGRRISFNFLILSKDLLFLEVFCLVFFCLGFVFCLIPFVGRICLRLSTRNGIIVANTSLAFETTIIRLAKYHGKLFEISFGSPTVNSWGGHSLSDTQTR